MPDKQKRRKTNKNKRKNKNNNWCKNNKNSDGVKSEVENEKCNEVTAEASVSELKENVIEKPSENKSSDTADVCVVDEFHIGVVNNVENSVSKCDNNTENTSKESFINEESLSDASISTSGTNAKKCNLDVNSITLSKSNNSSTKELQEILANVPDNPSPEQSYVVESPDQTLACKNKHKIKIQSKSLDNDDEPKIIEITDDEVAQSGDENSVAISTSDVVVTDIEWETTKNLQTTTEPVLRDVSSGKLSLTCPPILTAQCQQSSSLTPEEELSLRAYLDTLNLATHPPNSAEIKAEIEEIIKREVRQRLRKKAHTDDIISPRLGPPRQLDVIAEEGSGESSLASRRQSYLSEIKSDIDDLDDDVFLDNKPKRKDDCMPPRPRKINNKPALRQIPQKCVLVDTQIKEPELTEARGDWSVQTVEKIEGAEVVYLTDSSSSTSSVNDIGEEDVEDLDSDISVRMMTPTIEVTDTEKLLKKTFIKQDSEEANDSSAHVNDNKSDKTTSSNDFIEENVPQNFNEIIVLTTDNIQTSLYVKELTDVNNCNDKNLESCDRNHQSVTDNYDLEMKVLKCELNDAINNLIKEVVSDSENTNEREPLNRQDSSSSIGSSQCTAKYNPSSSSLNDVSNILHDDLHDTNKPSNTHILSSRVSSHVKDVFECVTGTLPSSQDNNEKDKSIYQPLLLRDICVKRISSLPYGEKILEELASVSKKLQSYGVLGSNIATSFEEKETVETKPYLGSHNNKPEKTNNMPYYPLPDVSSIEKVSLPTNQKSPMPPPVRPRKSSLNKAHDDSHWTGLPTQQEPVYMCLSPSQKMLMEKTNTVISKEDATQLIDMHKKYVDRRGYGDKGKNNEKETSNNPPAIPFKSQTGSRLLAIIRDPAVTNNINSSINKHLNKSLDQLQRESTFKKSFEHFNTPKETPPFKPIPPPRPRKSTIYESDESSDFTDSSLFSMKSEKKYFHYSTGALNEEIENDVSSIQDMHRRYTNIRDNGVKQSSVRRPSLPKDLCEQQMEYIRQKEKEVEAEIKRLEEMKLNMTDHDNSNQKSNSPINQENKCNTKHLFESNQYTISRNNDFAVQQSKKSPEKSEKAKVSSVFSNSQEEIMREKMYSEYMSQMAERQQRKEKKVIKITNNSTTKHAQSKTTTISKSMSALDMLESKTNNPIEKEFIWKARERWDKLGIKDPETEDERDNNKDVYKEPEVIKNKIKVIQGDQETDVQKLPSHLQEFVQLTAKNKEKSTDSPETVMIGPSFKARSTSPAVWRPGSTPPPAPAPRVSPGAPPPPPPPVWTPPTSPHAPRKAFRPVHFDDSPPARRKQEVQTSEQNGASSDTEGRLRTSHSAPAAGLSSLGTRLPRAQNPTVTLLQKAREGQLPRGSSYLQQQERDAARLPRDRVEAPRGDPVHALRREYASEGEAERGGAERGEARNMAAEPHRKIDGVGPTTKDGMPVTLRSEVKDPSKWYKKMYDTIHKSKYDDDYVTIRYKNRRGQTPQRVPSNKSQYAYFDPRSGYLSEPEGGMSRQGYSSWSDACDSDAPGPRRRTASVQDDRANDNVSSPYLPSNKYSTLASARASQEVYKNQPGRIENYVPGKSSVVEKEAKQWWDEVMDIFDGHLSSTTSLPQASPKEKKDITSAILSKSNMARALKESGYESDSTLIFRRRDEADGPLSPAERRAAYKDLQAGGEPPMRGFRSPAPPRQDDDTEIEYIPISPTLTKIRIHKKTPKIHEVVCYPITSVETDEHISFRKQAPSFISVNVPTRTTEYPPAPPRRVSSKNNRTLKLVDSTRTRSASPKTQTGPKVQSNVEFLKDKISHKLTRQNTHIINKKDSILANRGSADKLKARQMSTSAPPAVNRKSVSINATRPTTKSMISNSKQSGTSSFSSPRRTLLPTEYTNTCQTKYYSQPSTSVVIEGGAGRRTPISNILDRVTSLDKLWSADKRNEPLDKAKAKASVTKSTANSRTIGPKVITKNVAKPLSPSSLNRGRDMIRTAEKLQKLKTNHAKSTPCLVPKNDSKSTLRHAPTLSNISKSSSNIAISPKKTNQIKSAVVTSLKKKKSLENVALRPRSNPCHASCSKKQKEEPKKTKAKEDKKPNCKSSNDSEAGSQFGDAYEISNFGSIEDHLDRKRISSKEIKETRDAVISNSFFQHLFLGNTNVPVIAYPMLEPNTSVLQKARMFQSYPQDYVAPKSINSYLVHRKPVSLSRFKLTDHYNSPERAKSPRSISWPGRMHDDIRKFDSLSKCDFGSTSSHATERSRSEPPKLYFSQTSRPKSPTVVFCRREKSNPFACKISRSPPKIIFTQTSRPVSPKIVRKTFESQPPSRNHSISPTRIVFTETVRPISPTIKRRTPPKNINTQKEQERDKLHSTLYFSQTSRPVSPKVPKKSGTLSRSQSTSPVSIRSPSYRRIHSARLQHSKSFTDNAPKKIFRTRSADDADKSSVKNKPLKKTTSDQNFQIDDPDYDEYIRDMENEKIRSDRFRELNRYYSYLERVGELERATSTSDLRHRKKDEEIIDFDRWKRIRAIERAEEELNNLYFKLKSAQNENDVLFYPRDLKDFRWNFDKDRGLRIKEKSVEDLKDHFQQIPYYDTSLEPDQPLSKDTYKPLWRGTSVAETAFIINRKNDHTDKRESNIHSLKTSFIEHDTPICEIRKKIGIGNRLWSSLSMEQVNALKNQLNAIYSKELESKSNKEFHKYCVEVKDSKSVGKSQLHVRSNSLVTSSLPPVPTPEMSKSESIAAISCPTSVKDLKNSANKIQMTLSENEKRKISQTLSKEVLNRIKKFDDSPPPLPLKQELEEVEKSEERSREQKVISPTLLLNPISVTPDVICNERKKVSSPIEKSEIIHPSSASETETASSETSNKTVIYRSPSKVVQEKVEYFESVRNLSQQPNTVVYHARENSDEKSNQGSEKSMSSLPMPEEIKEREKEQPNKGAMVQSQSCANFKELFGESEKNKFLSLPSKPERHYSRSPSPRSEVNFSNRRAADTQCYSSSESIWRSRSPSPAAGRHWRAYLQRARAGQVRRLASRFDSPAPHSLRRHTSDPEITRNHVLSNWASFEALNSRSRQRTMLPVARVPLRPGNRFMPHIDIISKLAALRRRTAPRSRSAEEALECPRGEVEKIRRRFEVMSLLGQIYTSAPDVSELQDIAYLSGPWIAHRYPKKSDNNKSIEDPSSLICGRTSPVRKVVKKACAKEPVRLSSILKSDAFATQEFDPSLHRPARRYEPARAPPRPPPAAWSTRLAPLVASSREPRHTVTFQDADSAPEPPHRVSNGTSSDTESPRRYVEGDVNIHYRCPVRRAPLPLVPERELARQQADHMKRLYREQRRAKYLQDLEINPSDIDAFDASIKELQDMQNRRHQDNFTPAQKNILPLNRYDEADRTAARALYAFNGQTPRELSFKKGDFINVRRQIDSNWYEGELHGRIGLFPYNYVEILKGDVAQSAKKPPALEGKARAKFDFTAQTSLELPLKKGEVVVLTRRIDHNWWEGRTGNKTGIFPDSYVQVLQEPSQNKPDPQLNSDKPLASPASHGQVAGAARRSMGPHSYTPQLNSPALANAPPATQPLPGYTARPAQSALTPSDRGYGPPPGVDLNNTEPLYVDTNAEAVPYRAMYKYRPQNPDELELREGDTVYVLEQCDDGWYVGSSQRSGRLGTFPGNYVERI
ncbi:uncharacterized protein LOC105393136 isoform X6 [Plutella xylostella]|uniref:uncharacterized protein LOC105393136 isoform X6 n=1 Tax=Plutella xylostella TaxID=51655 RepID=UPI00203292CA|nr:uncharacterized protein LOC105393136 isoform X6 [Plutella xylostella]